MTQTKETPSGPTEENASDRKKRAEQAATFSVPDVRRRPDAVVRAVELRTTHGMRTVEIPVSPLATDTAAVDLARRRAGIPPREFRTGEVLPA
ncbi:hypothetical protein C469_15618 [Halorubrum lipolyticum DSM 21995]|uniref:Uncharacterized protein n=2 Tax=Halorubrum lipolyticum TaxID=368624 RepID=M0NJ88_9EURY|nr:hypothetical protein C469_15618 [Halorubrum lipolyticum DSM 21995]